FFFNPGTRRKARLALTGIPVFICLTPRAPCLFATNAFSGSLFLFLVLSIIRRSYRAILFLHFFLRQVYPAYYFQSFECFGLGFYYFRFFGFFFRLRSFFLYFFNLGSWLFFWLNLF